MEGLSRGDLQKLCLEQRKAGILPRETKCTGSAEKLRQILSNKDKPREGRYQISLRSLSVYLSLDKLLLITAHYPEIFTKELTNPQGKIWADRTWAELGEAPLNLKNGGTRYYHLWSTQSLSPYGQVVLTIEKGKKILLETGIKARQAFFNSDSQWSGKKKKGRRFRLWALEAQGLKTYGYEFTFDKVKEIPEKIKEGLEGAEGVLVTSKKISYIFSITSRYCYALDSEGYLHYYEATQEEINDRIFLVEGHKFRYMRKIYGVYFYGITFEGDHTIFDETGRVLKITKRPFSQDKGLEGLMFNFQRFYYRPEKFEGPKYEYDVGADLAKPLEGYPKMVPDQIYYLPSPELVQGAWVFGKFLPHRSGWTNPILGLNGKLYTDKSVYKEYVGGINHGITQVDYAFSKRKDPHRYFRYESALDYYVGIAW